MEVTFTASIRPFRDSRYQFVGIWGSNPHVSANFSKNVLLFSTLAHLSINRLTKERRKRERDGELRRGWRERG